MRTEIMKSGLICIMLCLAVPLVANGSTESIVLELDAANPGPAPLLSWTPAVGPADGGQIAAQCHSAGNLDDFKPQFMGEPVDPLADPNDPETLFYWWYRFHTAEIPGAPDLYGGGASVTNLGSDALFDHTDDFTIEAWVRPALECIGIPPEQCTFLAPGTYGLMRIFSTQGMSSNGYALWTQMYYPDANGRLQFQFRDNYGTQKRQWNNLTDHSKFMCGQWTHIVLSYKGPEASEEWPTIEMWMNGTWAGAVTGLTGSASWDDLDYTRDNVAMVSGKPSGYPNNVDHHYWFDGDIALVRVYGEKLEQAAVESLYAAGRPVGLKIDTEPDEPELVTDGLVLYMDAAHPGYASADAWRPVRPYPPQDGGQFAVYVDPDVTVNEADYLPALMSQEAGTPEDPSKQWFYRFNVDKFWFDHGDPNLVDPETGDPTPRTWSEGFGANGYVTNLAGNVGFDYDDDFTVEAWVRPGAPACIEDPENCDYVAPNTYGEMMIFGSENDVSSGWRLTAQKPQNLSDPDNLDPRPGQPVRMTLSMRDTQGDVTKRYFTRTTDMFSVGQWHHVMVTYDGQTDGAPDIKIYKNGTPLSTTNEFTGDQNDYTENNFVSDVAHIAGKTPFRDGITTRNAFEGDISVVRVYNRVLSYAEIVGNYEYGMVERVLTADINQDLAVNYIDFAMLAEAWQTTDPDTDLDGIGLIDIDDLAIMAENWLEY